MAGPDDGVYATDPLSPVGNTGVQVRAGLDLSVFGGFNPSPLWYGGTPFPSGCEKGLGVRYINFHRNLYIFLYILTGLPVVFLWF